MQQEDWGEREGGGGENDLILGIQDLDFDFNTLAKFLGTQDLSIHLKMPKIPGNFRNFGIYL